MAEFLNFNGISKSMVHENTGKDGEPFYSVGITPVPYSVSKTGVLNITLSKEEYGKRVRKCVSDAEKVNIGYPKADSKGNPWTIPAGNVSICTYQDDEGKKVFQSLADVAKKKGEDRLTELFGENSFEKYTGQDGEDRYSIKVSAIQDKVIEARKAIKAAKETAEEESQEAEGPEIG